MTLDMYSDKVAEASALIREFAKVDYFHYFARDPESSLEEFIAMLDQAEEKGRQSQAARIAEMERQLVEASAPAVDQDTDIPEALELLAAVFDAWENGDDCYEYPHAAAGYLGKAFRLDDDVFHRCCDLLNRRNPPRNAAPVASMAAQAPVREVPGWVCVDDRLPAIGSQVIAYRPTAESTQDAAVTLTRYTGAERVSWQGVSHGFDCICHPTHWMPLPAAPVQQDTDATKATGTAGELPPKQNLTLDNAPIGTMAPSINGGAWYRAERGWKWNNGSTFPRPGGDWNGDLIAPVEAARQPAPVAPTIVFDWPACNEGCLYEDPHGGMHDCRNEHCTCEAAKASICRQRAAINRSQP